MNKRQLKQSAADDFLQSLEHLDELWGDTADTVVLDSESQVTESDKPEAKSVSLSIPKDETQNQPNFHQP